MPPSRASLWHMPDPERAAVPSQGCSQGCSVGFIIHTPQHICLCHSVRKPWQTDTRAGVYHCSSHSLGAEGSGYFRKFYSKNSPASNCFSKLTFREGHVSQTNTDTYSYTLLIAQTELCATLSMFCVFFRNDV